MNLLLFLLKTICLIILLLTVHTYLNYAMINYNFKIITPAACHKISNFFHHNINGPWTTFCLYPGKRFDHRIWLQLRPSSGSILFDVLTTLDVLGLEWCTWEGGCTEASKPVTSEFLGCRPWYGRGDSSRSIAARPAGLIIPAITSDNSISKLFYLL